MLLGIDAVIISMDEVEKLVKAVELGYDRTRVFYGQLQEISALDVYTELRRCIKVRDELTFTEDYNE